MKDPRSCELDRLRLDGLNKSHQKIMEFGETENDDLVKPPRESQTPRSLSAAISFRTSTASSTPNLKPLSGPNGK